MLVPIQMPPVKFTHPELRIPLERYISSHLEREWTVRSYQDLADLACHPAALLSDGMFPVFTKYSDALNGRDQFETELMGLGMLSTLAGVRVPKPVGILQIDTGCILVMEAVQSVETTPRHWREVGQILARLHQVKGTYFGLERNGYFGPVFMDNSPLKNWNEFYAHRRLLPFLKLAVDSGNMPLDMIPRLEWVISHLPELGGPAVIPALLHGDAQMNNFIFSEEGVYLIDPAVHYGHPEMDLAMLDIYQPVPSEVFKAYQAKITIDEGFERRRGLWRLGAYLAAVSIEGAGYLGMLEVALKDCR